MIIRMSKATEKNRAILAGLATACVALGWTFYTQHTWEDFYIAFRVARNWVRGLGVVYNAGERVQVFSSPLGVLLLGVADWVGGSGSESATINWFRGANIIALTTTSMLLWRSAGAHFKHFVVALCTFGAVLLDAKAIDCAMGGMETGFFLLFLAFSLWTLLSASPQRAWVTGAAFAGLLWTRPDAIVYILALLIGAVSFLPERDRLSRWSLVSRLARASAVGAALYLPWLVWAWLYYGNPVPHSVAAKALVGEPHHLLQLAADALVFPVTLLFESTQAWRLFSPAYVGVEEVPPALQVVWIALAWIASVAWLVPMLRGPTRMLSFVGFCANFYLLKVVPIASPWYFPPAAIMAYLTIGLVADQFFSYGKAQKVAFSVTLSAAIALQGIVFVATAKHTRLQQLVIEDGVRSRIGMWLNAHACSASESVLLEPLGYVGYFSQLKMIDYLGLASEKMVALKRGNRNEWATLPHGARPDPALELDVEWLDAFNPDWLVLRPAELKGGLHVDQTRLLERYELKAVFDQTEVLRNAAIPFGKHTLGFYQTYWVLQRADMPTSCDAAVSS